MEPQDSPRQLFLSAVYMISPDDLAEYGVVRYGEYGQDRCGGPCSWVITEKNVPDTVDRMYCVPYGRERHFYLYSFYSCEAPKDEKLLDLYKKHREEKGVSSPDCDCISEFVILSTSRLAIFNHEKNFLIGSDGEMVDWDEIGGTIEYADLGDSP